MNNCKWALRLDDELKRFILIGTKWEVVRIEHIDGKDVAILQEVKPTYDPMAESIASQIENCNVEQR